MGSANGGWTRSKLTAALAVALVVVVGSTPQPSDAQEVAGVGNGIAKATAIVAKVAPGVGALELGITSGISVAETTNALAQAQSQAADLGLIGTTLTSEGCGDATFGPEDLPQPLRVDNRAGDTSAARDEVEFDGSVLGGGRLQAAATTTPASSASASGVGFSIDPLLDFAGGRADASAEVLPGRGRQAVAVVESSLDIAGLVRLDGMRWSALHRTGAERVVEGSFEIGSAEIGGLPFPGDELQPVEDAANTLLALSGISIDFPEVQYYDEPTDLVRVTPLRVVLRDSPAGGLILGPVLNASRAQREQMFDDLSAAICEAAGVLLVGDIAVSVASGTGFLAFEIGGAEAISGDFVVGEVIGLPPAPGPAVPGPDGPTADLPSVGAAPDSSGGGVPSLPNDQAADVPLTPVADVGPLERVCESVHPFDWPSCSQGAAPMAGLIGLAATAAMFGLDLRRQRAGRGESVGVVGAST
ncbi:hypothetical protein [Actinospongicola halichondriae]|uniref:hypothetical protein n=1 Tax=Actinospongicola halichondriae TaxID=3236844 RepID=UPI003D3C4F51